MKLSHALIAGLILLVFGILAGMYFEAPNTRREKERGEAERTLRIEQRREADRLDAQRLDSLEASEARVREAEARAERAERRLVWQMEETAALNVTVIETNVGCSPEHKEADRLLALSNEAEKKEIWEIAYAAQSRGDALEMRAISAEVTLEARDLECETCRQEANTWRRAANPGWFTRFRRSLPQTALTVGGVLLLVVAL